MAHYLHGKQRDLSGETVTCAEELPHLDLQEYIYDCAHKLYVDSPGLSYHVVIVANAVEQHAELLLANNMDFEEVKVLGISVPVRKLNDPTSVSSTRSTNREAMEMLLLECKRLLSESERAPDTVEPYEPSPGSPRLRVIRKQILQNARKGFPELVKEYTAGLTTTRTVMTRDDKCRPIYSQVAFTLHESKIFDIAIVRGPANSLQAALVHGPAEDLKIALYGKGERNYHCAIEALLEATVHRLHSREEDELVFSSLPKSDASLSGSAEAVRVDSPLAEVTSD